MIQCNTMMIDRWTNKPFSKSWWQIFQKNHVWIMKLNCFSKCFSWNITYNIKVIITFQRFHRFYSKKTL